MSTDNPWLDRSVDELELSVRSTAGLQALGITTIRELVSYSAADLTASRKFGSASIRELEGWLADMGLSLRSP